MLLCRPMKAECDLEWTCVATEGPLVAMSKFVSNEISVRKLQFQFLGIVNNHLSENYLLITLEYCPYGRWANGIQQCFGLNHLKRFAAYCIHPLFVLWW